MKHRNSDKTGMRSVSKCNYRSLIAAESLTGLKVVISHHKETGALIRKTARQNFRDHELKVSWHPQSIQIFSIHIWRLETCDLCKEEFKTAVLNNSVCYRKYSKIIEQKQENNKQMNSKQWTKQFNKSVQIINNNNNKNRNSSVKDPGMKWKKSLKSIIHRVKRAEESVR